MNKWLTPEEVKENIKEVMIEHGFLNDDGTVKYEYVKCGVRSDGSIKYELRGIETGELKLFKKMIKGFYQASFQNKGVDQSITRRRSCPEVRNILRIKL